MKNTLLHVALATTLFSTTGPAMADPDTFAEWNVMGEAAPEVVATGMVPTALPAPVAPIAAAHADAPTNRLGLAHLHANAVLTPPR